MVLLLEHLPEALVAGGIGWWASGNPFCLPAALLAGWLIDIDHLFDFFWYAVHDESSIDWSLVGTGGYFSINNKVFVLFHSWEITFLLMVLATLQTEQSAVFASAGAAHGAHLIHDQIAYQVRPLGYFFLARLSAGFSQREFCHRGEK